MSSLSPNCNDKYHNTCKIWSSIWSYFLAWWVNCTIHKRITSWLIKKMRWIRTLAWFVKKVEAEMSRTYEWANPVPNHQALFFFFASPSSHPQLSISQCPCSSLFTQRRVMVLWCGYTPPTSAYQLKIKSTPSGITTSSSHTEALHWLHCQFNIRHRLHTTIGFAPTHNISFYYGDGICHYRCLCIVP